MGNPAQTKAEEPDGAKAKEFMGTHAGTAELERWVWKPTTGDGVGCGNHCATQRKDNDNA